LAANGSWTAFSHLALDLVATATARPHQILQFKLCHVLALMRLADYGAAVEFIDTIGKFDDRYNCFEHYPKIYPKLAGSMVPFSLRLAKAALPFFADKDRSLDQLFELLDWLAARHRDALHRARDADAPADGDAAATARLAHTTEIDEAARAAMASGVPIAESQVPVQRWLQRIRRTRLLCAALLSRDGKPGMAAALLERELPPSAAEALSDSDVQILSALVQLYITMGDLEEATRVCDAIESGAATKPLSQSRRVQVLTSRGLLSVAHGKFAEATDFFHAALSIDSGSVVAANNRAVCLLYLCALPHAVLTLEQTLASGHLHQTVIGNLCTLYDLASDKSSDKKKQLLGLVSRYASDDFITQELAPKLSAASGTTSVSKAQDTPPGTNPPKRAISSPAASSAKPTSTATSATSVAAKKSITKL
jgi:tetratricopeptide (TPR) repeat protein